jgi:hypothetical protein
MLVFPTVLLMKQHKQIGKWSFTVFCSLVHALSTVDHYLCNICCTKCQYMICSDILPSDKKIKSHMCAFIYVGFYTFIMLHSSIQTYSLSTTDYFCYAYIFCFLFLKYIEI